MMLVNMSNSLKPQLISYDKKMLHTPALSVVSTLFFILCCMIIIIIIICYILYMYIYNVIYSMIEYDVTCYIQYILILTHARLI